MPQVTLTLPPNPLNAIDGYKTYIVLAAGAIVLALNHFGFLPHGMIPNDPANWINDEYTLLLGGTFRSALAK